MNAAIYCRISRDPTGDAAGVARQEAECRAMARLRGLTVTEVLIDNDISAYSGAPRPAYAQLLDAVRAGGVQVVLAWHPDRLHRSLHELEQFIAVIDAHAIEVVTVTAGDVDLSTPIGRMIARQLGTFARYESEHRSERVKAAMRQKAFKGEWSGRRPYGYDFTRDSDGRPTGDGRLTVVPREARVIREAANRIIAGETVYGVCRDFNTRGIPSPLGNRWRTPSLRSILVSPTAAGQRDHLGTVVGPGLWAPILTPEQHAALRDRLSDNRRTKGALPARRYLLSGGLTVCGRCGTRLATMRRSDKNRRVYSCIRSVDRDGCGKLSISAQPLEAHVAQAVFGRVGPGAMARLIANPRAFRSEIARRTSIETRLLDLAQLYSGGELSRAEWQVCRRTLIEQLRTLPSDPTHLGGMTLSDSSLMHAEWERLDLDRRRALLQLVIDVIVIQPAPRKGPKLHPARVEIRWR